MDNYFDWNWNLFLFGKCHKVFVVMVVARFFLSSHHQKGIFFWYFSGFFGFFSGLFLAWKTPKIDSWVMLRSKQQTKINFSSRKNFHFFHCYFHIKIIKFNNWKEKESKKREIFREKNMNIPNSFISSVFGITCDDSFSPISLTKKKLKLCVFIFTITICVFDSIIIIIIINDFLCFLGSIWMNEWISWEKSTIR